MEPGATSTRKTAGIALAAQHSSRAADRVGRVGMGVRRLPRAVGGGERAVPCIACQSIPAAHPMFMGWTPTQIASSLRGIARPVVVAKHPAPPDSHLLHYESFQTDPPPPPPHPHHHRRNPARCGFRAGRPFLQLGPHGRCRLRDHGGQGLHACDQCVRRPQSHHQRRGFHRLGRGRKSRDQRLFDHRLGEWLWRLRLRHPRRGRRALHELPLQRQPAHADAE